MPGDLLSDELVKIGCFPQSTLNRSPAKPTILYHRPLYNSYLSLSFPDPAPGTGCCCLIKTRSMRPLVRHGVWCSRRRRRSTVADVGCECIEEEYEPQKRLGQPLLRRPNHTSNQLVRRDPVDTEPDLRVDGPERALLQRQG